VKINAKLVNPFVEAATSVMKQAAGVEVRRGHLSYRGRPEHRYGVSIVIWVHGYLSGQVVFNMRTEVAEKLVERMLGGEPPQEREQQFSDMIGKLANMITVKAASLLNQGKDRTLSIEAPAVVTGEQTGVTLVSKPTLVCDLHTQCGQVEMNVALAESDEVFGDGEGQEQGEGR
jgi:chemotaxis protein CheX